MSNWDREYLKHKQEYLDLFDKSMQKDQEQNVEFLEDKLKRIKINNYEKKYKKSKFENIKFIFGSKI